MTTKPSNTRKAGKASTAGKGRVIALTNFKGGVGKTSSALNISAALAHAGYRVLLVDLDGQANATTGLFRAGFERNTVGEWLLGTSATADVLQKLPDPQVPAGEEPLYLHLIPSYLYLADHEQEIHQLDGFQQLLAEKLQPLRTDYDYIILDCPPSVGAITQMALVAADAYAVPCLPDKYSFDGLQLVKRLADRIQVELNPKLKLAGIFFTQYNANKRRELDHYIVGTVEAVFGVKAVLPSIREDVTVKAAQVKGVLALRYKASSNAVADYKVLTEALVAAL